VKGGENKSTWAAGPPDSGEKATSLLSREISNGCVF